MENNNANFGEKGLELIKKIKKSFLLVGVYIFIGGIVLGAISILVTGQIDAWSYIGKAISTLIIVALMFGITTNSLQRMAYSPQTSQALAMVAFGVNVVWGILCILTIWTMRESCSEFETVCGLQTNDILSRLTTVAWLLLLAFFSGANIMALKEYNKTAMIRPIKITAAVCVMSGFIYEMVEAMLGGQIDASASEVVGRLRVLAVFMIVMGLIAWIVVAIMSRDAKNKLEKAALKARRMAMRAGMANAPVSANRGAVKPAGVLVEKEETLTIVETGKESSDKTSSGKSAKTTKVKEGKE